MKYGLIGEHLGHSFSREVHSMLADYEYELLEIPRDKLDAFMTQRDFDAINVTIPYKEAVIPYLSFISDEAKMIGSVNTVVNRGGRLYGYNTDFLGMKALIEKMNLNLSGKKTVILGTGGTSKTAFAVAKSLGAGPIIAVSRTKKNGATDYGELVDKHTDAQIIINTTPVGMYPDNFSAPIDLSLFKKAVGVIDAIYNPLNTELVLNARKNGINAEGGLYMLVAQAVYACQIFLDKEYSREKLDEVFTRILRKKENIVLIGMPSSGKTTVSHLISKKLHKDVLDTDAMVENSRGITIKEIFESEGEGAFRDYESKEIANASLQNGVIISTGGGSVLKEKNISMLKQNGKVFFIDRPCDKLISTPERPLSHSKAAIEKMHRERYPLYVRAADYVIDASGTPDTVANKIIGEFLK